MTAARDRRPRPLPARPLPAGALAALLVALAAVVWLSQQVSSGEVPDAPKPFVPPASTQAPAVYTVKDTDGDTLALVGEKREGEQQPEERQLRVGAATKVEVLRATTIDSLASGDVLNVAGIPNEVRNFSVHSVVVLPAGAAAGDGGVARSEGGFAGHEAALDRRDRPVLSGRVTGVAGDRVLLETGAGPAEVTLTGDAPLYRLGAGAVADIRPGDRVAFETGADGQPPALLVLPAR